MARSRLPHALSMLLGALATCACYGSDNGRSPPLERIYFPVGLIVSPPAAAASGDAGGGAASGSRWLYVANSDFDLQFNAGSLQVYDLEKLRAALKQPGVCAPGQEQSAANRLLYPGPCNPVDTKSFLAASVQIGAFVTGMTYARNPDPAQGGPEARLFLPTRGEARLDWVDVADEGDANTLLECGQNPTTRACDENHRRGTEPSTPNGNDAVLPPEPFGVAVDDVGRAVVTAHQTSGQVSLFVNDWRQGPSLQFVLGGLPSGAMNVASVPTPRIALPTDPANPCSRSVPYQPGFLLTFRTAAQVQLLRFFEGCAANPEVPDGGFATPFLEGSRAAVIGTNSSGFDSRGIAIDAEARRACENACPVGSGRETCLTGCATVPLDVYVANRTPATLVIGKTRSDLPAPPGVETNPPTSVPSSDAPVFIDSVPVSAGASTVAVGKVLDRNGKAVTRVFIVSFDARQIFVYDPVPPGRIETTIATGRGPQAIAIDAIAQDEAAGEPGHAFGYVAQFTDSYVGVVDLDQRHVETYGQMILTLGEPVPPRASK